METQRKPRAGKSLRLADYIQERVELKRQLGRISTAELYRAAGNHFLSFVGDRNFRLNELTSTKVADFVVYLQSLKLRTNSINSYLSSLRAIYNAALREGLCRKDVLPFTGLKLKRELTGKRAVPIRVVERIAAATWEGEADLEQAADLAIFSFIACGMPFADMVRLKKENIVDGELTYHRRKTGTRISLKVTQGMRQILQKYANTSPYLFPFVCSDDSHSKYKRLLAKQNRSLCEIGTRLGLQTRLTSYVMRHTWASEAFRQHVPVAVIGQALGHSSEKTTRIYLAQLDRSEQDQANAMIISTVEKLMGKGKKPYL